ACGQPVRIILVPRAADDAGVDGILPVQAREMTAIERQNTTAVRRGVRQDLWVAAAGMPRLLNRGYVVPQGAEAFDDAVMEILVGVQQGHERLRLRVLPDGLLDLLRV